MCMKRGNGQCIFTGNLISDNSFVAVTAESGQCRPFSSDPLEVRTSISHCGNFNIFVSLRFYVKSILRILEVQKLVFWPF